MKAMFVHLSPKAFTECGRETARQGWVLLKDFWHGLFKQTYMRGTSLLLFSVTYLAVATNPHYATINLYQSPPNQGYLAGAGNYYVGATVTIATIPSNTTYTFSHWSDGNTNATRNITVPRFGQSFTAYYNHIAPPPPPQVNLTNVPIWWIPEKVGSNITYKVTLVPGGTYLTTSTNYTFQNLTNGAGYTVWVNAFQNNLESVDSCVLSFTVGHSAACP
jgi:hypothetical protein